MKINMPRICPKSFKGIKTFQMRMRRKLETNEVNVSWICPKSVRGIKTFQMRIKIKVKTNDNQHASDLSEKRQRN